MMIIPANHEIKMEFKKLLVGGKAHACWQTTSALPKEPCTISRVETEGQAFKSWKKFQNKDFQDSISILFSGSGSFLKSFMLSD